MLNLNGTAQLPVIRQTEAAECGLACLAMVASYFGHRIDLNTLRRRHPVSLKGVTLRGLIQVASHLQLTSRPVRFEMEQLKQLRLPAIAHWDLTHFVVLKSSTSRGIEIHDPAAGERFYKMAEASKHLTGVALELLPAEGFSRKDERARLPLSVFWAQIQGSTHALVQIFMLSTLLEAFVIASPFYLQLTVDEVIARGDVDLLLVLALGFGLLMAMKVVAASLRSLLL
jgi:ATP-binding cassette subfamily B protein RaxB